MEKQVKEKILIIKNSMFIRIISTLGVVLLIVTTLVLSQEVHGQYNPETQEQNNIISFSVDGDIESLPDTLEVTLMYHPDASSPVRKMEVIRFPKNQAQFSIVADRLVSVQFQALQKRRIECPWLLEPGDNVTVSYDQGKLLFKGRGANNLKLCDEISHLIGDFSKSKAYLVTKSAEDCVKFSRSIEGFWKTIDDVLETYRPLVSTDAYDFIRASVLSVINNQQSHKFYGLYLKILKDNSYTEKTGPLLSNLYDSVYANTASFKEMKLSPVWIVATNAYYRSLRLGMLREANFPKRFSMGANLARIMDRGKKQFVGLAKDYFLYDFLTEYVIDEHGLNENTENVLAAYYEDSGNPAYKENVKRYELNARMLYPGEEAPEIFASGVMDKSIKKLDFKNKITLLDFEVSGDLQSLRRKQVLKNIRDRFKIDTSLIVVKLSAAVTGKHILRAYNILDSSYAYLIDDKGKLITDRIDIGELESHQLLNTISDHLELIKKKHWIANNDGPYVIKEGLVERSYSIVNSRVVVESIDRDKRVSFNVSTDLPGKTFKVALKKKLAIEDGEYEKPEKLLAMSDIEGNFDALRKLLQENGVINATFEWTFGKGHLVLIGDMVDRGDQVTECLWLIYSLEEKAKAAGGHVHFILGNHEIMNMNGDLRYVQKKYIKEQAVFNKNYANDLYGNASELGQWLRTKNVIEKVGDILFVHAGISKEMNDLKLSINEINQLARSSYSKSQVAIKSTDKRLSLIYNSKLSPFWYRDYYLEDSIRIGIGTNRIDTTYRTSSQVINDILRNYAVNKIVTGHTIFKGNNNYGKFVSAHYSGKVINTDTRHALGHSEALYVENDMYYSIDDDGKRYALLETTDRIR